MQDELSQSTITPETPGFGGRLLGMFNIFIDPFSAAKFVAMEWSWVAPLVLNGLIIGITGWLNVPLVLRAMLRNPPRGMAAEQLEKALPTIALTQKIAAVASPIIVIAVLALFAGLMAAACVVLDVRAKYRDHFALLSNASLIGALQQVAGFVVVRLRSGEVQSLKELRPGFGLDLLLSGEANKLLSAILGYFSIFTVWYIVMLGLTFACLHGVSKGKAFGITAPVWVAGMVFAVIGSLAAG